MVQSAVVPPTTTAVDLKHWLEQVGAGWGKAYYCGEPFFERQSMAKQYQGTLFSTLNLETWQRWVSGACWANVAFRIVLFSQVASSESSGKIQVLQMEPTNSHQFAQSLHKLVAKWSFLLRRWLGWVWVSTLRYAPWTKKLWASHGACHVWWPGKAAKILTNGNQNKHTWE